MSNETVIPTPATPDVCTAAILVDGKEIPGEFHILSLSVTRELNRIPTATIQLRDGEAAKSTFTASNSGHFVPGKEIEIQLGYRSSREPVFKGIVVKHGIRIRKDGSLLNLECRDKAVKMSSALKSRYFEDQKDSAIMEEIIGSYKLEPVRILLQKGIGALWEWVKAEVSSHLQEIFTKIKQEIFEAIIKKALIWVGTLFIPGLGFIRLVQAIYKALRWLVDNIDRIVEIVNSFLDSVALAVKGNVGGIVTRVVNALTLGVVIAIDFLAKLVGLGNFADKLQRAIQSLKKPIQKAIDFVLTKARPVVRKIERAILKAAQAAKKAAAAGKKAVEKVLRFFGIKKYFSTNTGEKHALFFEKRGGRTVLLIESSAQDIRKFVEYYASERKLDANKTQMVSQIMSFLESYDEEYAALKKVGETSEKAKPIHERLLQKNVTLGDLLRTLLSGDRKVGMTIESYLLEGMTGTYASMPRPPMDILTPDHQPQAAIIKWTADLKGPVSRKKIYSGSSDIANRASGAHASGGYAINLHETRHMAGRTYGSKGDQTKNDFITFIKGEIAGEADDQKIRNTITARMKKELGWDVEAMRDVIKADKNYSDIDGITDLTKDEKKKLKGDIKIQITKGLRQIENQPMNTLKDY